MIINYANFNKYESVPTDLTTYFGVDYTKGSGDIEDGFLRSEYQDGSIDVSIKGDLNVTVFENKNANIIHLSSLNNSSTTEEEKYIIGDSKGIVLIGYTPDVLGEVKPITIYIPNTIRDKQSIIDSGIVNVDLLSSGEEDTLISILKEDINFYKDDLSNLWQPLTTFLTNLGAVTLGPGTPNVPILPLSVTYPNYTSDVTGLVNAIITATTNYDGILTKYDNLKIEFDNLKIELGNIKENLK